VRKRTRKKGRHPAYKREKISIARISVWTIGAKVEKGEESRKKKR